MSIKIQINSQAALERLLGDEEDMEIEVRKSVVEAFARGFVKNINNVTSMKDTANQIARNQQKSVEREASKALKEAGVTDKHVGWNTTIELSDKIVSKIHSEVFDRVYRLIQEEIDKIDVSEIVEARVNARVDSMVRTQTKKRLLEKLDEVL